jgi:hypothetical protein
MATVTIKVTKGGVDQNSAAVTAGSVIYGNTNSSGLITGTVANDANPQAVMVVITGSGWSYGGGPHVLTRGATTTIDV